MFSVVHPSVITSCAVQNSQHKVSKIQWYEHELNMSGIEYPVDIRDIGKCEHQNNISVDVYGYEDKRIFSLRITTMTVTRHNVNLLHITADETSHYVFGERLEHTGTNTEW